MKYLLEQNILTEWDDDKNEENIKKHGLDFKTAELVFSDEYRVELFDEQHSADEERYITIGMVNDILFVVYTLRDERYRLISARLATKKERQMYYGYYKKQC